MTIRPIKTQIFQEGEDLVVFIEKHVPRLKNSSVLAVTSKIVALSERRTIQAKGKGQKAKVIRAESEWALPAKYVWLTLKDGMYLANAGVDESNARGKLVLLPRDSFKSAHELRLRLKKHYKLKKFGIVITDSRVSPLRSGVVGVALGYAGFKGLRDYRGKYDLFGRAMKFTQTNIADSIATAAVLVMGEGREQQPLAVIEGASVEFVERTSRKEIEIPIKDDMYRPLFSGFLKRRRLNR